MTFASLLTPEGMVVAGTLITTLISVLRTAVPITATVSGALLAFAFSAVLYVLVGIVVGVATPDAALTIFAAWLTVAAAAVGIHESVTRPVVTALGPKT